MVMAADAAKRSRLWFWLPALIAVLLVALYANTAIIDGKTRPAAPRQGGSLIDAGAIQANVKVQGAGPAIVLIHGFAAAIDWWDEIAPGLALDHRVVSIDLIGHGGTTAPASDYSIERQAALVREVLDKLDIDRAAIIGHSMGGEVATAYGEAYPDKVDGLVLIDSPPTAASRDYDALTELYLTPIAGELLSHFRSDAAIRHGLAQAFAPDFKKMPAAFVDDVRQPTYTAFRSAHYASVAFRREKPINVRLAAIKPMPALLVVFGAQDAFVPSENARLFEQIPEAKVVTLDGVGHSPMVEAPDKTLALIRSFLSDVR
jgi:pimeloyl-ACP methyl ester carboxylesterase